MIPAVNSERFARAYETIGLVEEGSVRPIRSMANQIVQVDGVDLRITDNPILRLVEAVRIVFPETVEGTAATMRLFLLFQAINEAKEGDDILHLVKREGSETIAVHDTLIHAMAEVPIASDGKSLKFLPKLLTIAVRNLRAREVKST